MSLEDVSSEDVSSEDQSSEDQSSEGRPRVDGPPRAEPSPPESPLTTLHVRRAAAGDAESLGWVVERFTPFLIAQARYRLGPRLRALYDPEDVVNDAWAVALPRLSDLPERGGRLSPTILKFLATTVLHRVNTLLQKHILGKAPTSSARDGGEGTSRLADDTRNVVTRAVRRELHGEVVRGLGRLDDRDREILLLRAVEQRPVDQVAAELGLRPNTVVVRYRRALEKARRLLPASVIEELAPS